MRARRWLPLAAAAAAVLFFGSRGGGGSVGRDRLVADAQQQQQQPAAGGLYVLNDKGQPQPGQSRYPMLEWLFGEEEVDEGVDPDAGDPLAKHCKACKAGEPGDGGLALVGGRCTGFCSVPGYCGNNRLYRKGGVDCRLRRITRPDGTTDDLIEAVGVAMRQYSTGTKVKLNELVDQMDGLAGHLTGERHLDMLNDAYIQGALRIQNARRMQHEQIPTSLEHVCELLVLIPTAHRHRAGSTSADDYRHLRTTVGSLGGLKVAPNGLDSACVLVVNLSPGEHADFSQLQRKNIALSHPKDVVARAPPQCKQCRLTAKHDSVQLNVDGICPAWCSGDGYCGRTKEFQLSGSTDCGTWLAADKRRHIDTIDGGVHPACAPHGCTGSSRLTTMLAGDRESLGAAPPQQLSPIGRCLGYCVNRTCYADDHGLEGGRVDCTESNITTTSRYVEQIYFGDPFPADGAEQQMMRHGHNLARALLEASQWRAKYVMLLEDDAPACDGDALAGVDEAIAAAGEDWAVVRTGIGTNGAVIHWEDCVPLGNYLMKHLNVAPVERLVPEWAGAAGPGPAASTRRAVFTSKSNLFGRVQYSVPNQHDRAPATCHAKL